MLGYQVRYYLDDVKFPKYISTSEVQKSSVLFGRIGAEPISSGTMSHARKPPIIIPPSSTPTDPLQGAAFIFVHGLGDEAEDVESVYDHIVNSCY